MRRITVLTILVCCLGAGPCVPVPPTPPPPPGPIPVPAVTVTPAARGLASGWITWAVVTVPVPSTPIVPGPNTPVPDGSGSPPEFRFPGLFPAEPSADSCSSGSCSSGACSAARSNSTERVFWPRLRAWRGR